MRTFVLLGLVLLALIGLGGYLAGWHIAGEIALRKARQALARAEFAAARAHLAPCLQAWPSRADIHLLAAQAARRAEAYEDAEYHLKRARQLQAPADALELEGALLHAQRGDLDRVETYLLQGVQNNHPDTVLILESLALGNYKTHQLGRAHHCLNQLLERQPEQVHALVWRGRILELLRRPDEARADFQKAVELNPDRAEARLGLGNSWLQAHRAREAVDHFEWLRERQPENPEVLLGLARCRHELGQREEARQLLEALVAQQPRHAQAVGELGKLTLAAGQPADAERWLHRAVTLAPYEGEFLYLLSQCLNRQGKKEEAQQYVAKLRKIEEDQERLKALTQEFTKAPSNAALRYEGGVLLLRNGMEQEGLHWLTLALQADPRHRPTHQALADYYERTGKTELAAYHRRLSSAEGSPGRRGAKEKGL